MDDQSIADRALIPETIVKMYYGFDHRKPEILRNEVFAPRVYADFSAIFGGSGYELSGQEMVDMYMKMRDYATAAQHCLSGILPLFPPTTSVQNAALNEISVFANVNVYLRRDLEGVDVKDADCNGSIEVRLVRQGDGKGGNPWRVASIKAGIIRHNRYPEFWADFMAKMSGAQ